MEIKCEKCGTIATGLTRLLAKHQQREHVLNHRRVRVGVIVTVEGDDPLGTCAPLADLRSRPLGATVPPGIGNAVGRSTE